MKKIIITVIILILGTLSYLLFFQKKEDVSPTTQNQQDNFPSFTQNDPSQSVSLEFQENTTNPESLTQTQPLSQENRISDTLQKNIASWKQTSQPDKIKEIIVFASTIDTESTLEPIEVLLSTDIENIFEQVQGDTETESSFYSILNWFIENSEYFKKLTQEEQDRTIQIFNTVEY